MPSSRDPSAEGLTRTHSPAVRVSCSEQLQAQDCIYHMAALSPPPPGPTFVLRGTQSPVNTLHFGPPSQALGSPLLFSGSQSGLVHIWSLQTRRTVATLNGHGGQGVTWLKTLPQGHQLLSQGRDLRLCLWDLAEGRNTILDEVQLDSVGFCKSSILAWGQLCWMLAVPGKGNSEVQGMTSDEQPKGEDCASTRYMYILEVMMHEEAEVTDTKSAEPTGHDKDCPYLRTQEDPIMAEERGWSVQILEMPSKTSVCTLKPEADAKPGMPMCLGLWQINSSPRPLLLAGYEDGSVTLWDISERKVCSRIACHEEPVMGLDFDSQKAKGVSGSAGKVLAVWSLDGQQSLQVCKTQELTNPGIAEVTIRPDHKLLATAGWDYRIRVFHWRTMKPLAVLAFHSASVYCVAFATDGLLAAGSKDQRISIWSLYPCP
ncbi:Guanine nucleotide-binding protein subunit beta-like protein 1 [Microtus ochrogaster]|uniref:Guanine nucleotide-binding protein subunit beta-like protein 1 n=1 Tax=Microtus ochrogaster TaxID=79684 RepID=A0A8J6G506_MICOH|nr:Guanine nucleotide-binding protein subunit beta-like protein 1 [Microtus ochrogaster]